MRCLTLLALLMAMMPSAMAFDMYYNVTVTYDKGSVSLGSIAVDALDDYDLQYYRSMNSYSAITMDGGKALKVYFFDFDTVRKAVAVKDGAIVDAYDIVLQKNTVSAYFPYDASATDLVIRDSALKEVLRVNLKAVPAEKAVAAPVVGKKSPVMAYAMVAGAFALLLILVLWLMIRKKE